MAARPKRNGTPDTMVFFLYSVSLILLASGGAAALYGAGNLRTESGTTLAMAGVLMACAGFLMFAVVACLSELRRIRKLVEEGEAVPAPPPVAPVQAVPPAVAPEPVVSSGGMPPVPAAQMPSAPMPPAKVLATPSPSAGAAAAAAAAATAAAVMADRPEPVRDERGGEDTRPAAAQEPAPKPEPEVEPEPRPLPAIAEDQTGDEPDGWDPTRPAHVPAREVSARGPEEGGREEERPAPQPVEVQPPREALPEPVLDEPALEEPPRPTITVERTLVATYTSGDNTYFMYSDGAIEADTPTGRFRFASMDELRGFVETGTGGVPVEPGAGA